jgi:hypothetical protein
MKKILAFLLLFGNGYHLLAQNLTTDSLQQKFHTYQLNVPQEKIFIHTDKTFYLSGETIWLKAYLVDASFHRPLGVSKISYIEVLNKDLKPVLQVKISMNKGFGNGYLVIPGFLTSGNYILRAYTNWMKNFSPDFYFEQAITIVNTMKRLTIVNSSKHNPVISFFPEGGHLVAGFDTKIAFKSVDSNGMGLNCHGVIVSRLNDTIVAFQSLHNGMGSFQFAPEKKMDYYAVLRLGDSLIKQKLPAAEDQGFSMEVNEENPDILKVWIRATPEWEGSQIFLFAQTRQVAKNIQLNKLINGQTRFSINKKDLGEGISTITVFNADRQPVCERLVFKRPEKKLTIIATTDQQTYDQRSPVNIDLLARINDQNAPANLSASVFMIDGLQKVPGLDIVSYLYLNSDLKGNIESPSFYFENIDKGTDSALDNLLLTQGWRRFKWEEVWSGRKPAFEFIPELEGQVATGRIINKKTGSFSAGTDAFVTMPGEDRSFGVATSDSSGFIRYSFRDVNINNVIVMQPALKNDSDKRIDILNAWSDQYSSVPVHPLSLSKMEQKELLNRSVNNQIENTFAVEKKHIYVNGFPDSSSFYGQPEKVYFLDKYVRYQTMEEVLREFVIDVRIRKDADKYNLRVKNSHTDLYYDGTPLMLVDGIPVDATTIVGLDPMKIKKIELIAHEYYMGSFVFNGIIHVRSYSGEVGATQIDPNATVLEYEAIQGQREFYSPSYDNESARQSRLPDYRNVLDWSPKVVTGTDGKSHITFFTSDVPGKFVVFLLGITQDGVPGCSLTSFEVRNSGNP